MTEPFVRHAEPFAFCHPEHIRYAQCRLREGSHIALRVNSVKNLRAGSVKDLWQTDPLPPADRL